MAIKEARLTINDRAPCSGINGSALPQRDAVVGIDGRPVELDSLTNSEDLILLQCIGVMAVRTVRRIKPSTNITRVVVGQDGPYVRSEEKRARYNTQNTIFSQQGLVVATRASLSLLLMLANPDL